MPKSGSDRLRPPSLRVTLKTFLIKRAKASWVECGINTGLEGLHVRHKLEASHTRTQDIDGITAVWQPPAVALLASAGERDGGPDPVKCLVLGAFE